MFFTFWGPNPIPASSIQKMLQTIPEADSDSAICEKVRSGKLGPVCK